MPSTDIAARKAEHLALASEPAAQFQHTTTMLEHVHLVHQALPELAVNDIDLSTRVAGLVLRAPLMISGMTGGAPESGAINRALARVAERLGLAFGVGSQRAMAEHPELTETYAVRDAAPDVVLLGNLGVMQAHALGPARVRELARRIGASAMVIHLNPAQELAQDGGDRDFRGATAILGYLVDAIGMPVIVKETGAGISPHVAAALRALGVAAIDVAGAGGTSWVAVEAMRSQEPSSTAFGEAMREWGLPTAVSTMVCAHRGGDVIASGGIRHALDVARALALGARACGVAQPALQAWRQGGADGAQTWLAGLIAAVRSTMLLTGCADVAAMARAPKYIAPPLAAYVEAIDPRTSRP